MEIHFDAMERSRNEVSKEKLAQDLKTLAHDAEELLVATAADMSEQAKEARQRLHAALHSARETCQHLEAQAVVAAKATDKLIREYPYSAVGIAFGAGLLAGLWLNRE